jgi:branched-chain amino acid aminotransferase
MEIIPYDKRSGKIWFNGDNIDWSKAQVHLLSHGLHYASCVFEGVRVYDGEVFKLKEHIDRLFYSAKRMSMNIPYSVEEISNATRKIVEIQKTQKEGSF